MIHKFISGLEGENPILIKNPNKLEQILDAAKKIDFKMSCDLETGHLLRTLVSSKPNGKFLELGTGAGVSTCWILEGMDTSSSLTSVEMDEKPHDIAKTCLENDKRVSFVTMDGGEYIRENTNKKFDLIFADTWPGKFYLLEDTLDMVDLGGIYIIDDMITVDTWPKEHIEKVKNLVQYLERRDDFHVSQLNWSTGIMIAVRKTKLTQKG